LIRQCVVDRDLRHAIPGDTIYPAIPDVKANAIVAVLHDNARKSRAPVLSIDIEDFVIRRVRCPSDSLGGFFKTATKKAGQKRCRRETSTLTAILHSPDSITQNETHQRRRRRASTVTKRNGAVLILSAHVADRSADGGGEFVYGLRTTFLHASR
jgi:hypothetical protein